ncbi:DEAD/DEAH box helicase family protein [Enterocloster clostridioformis]|uniref:DEAD/DEAH box helicase family protein n=1 Tax=Enterocloster clostridioformis TaxID=1531 RepID=UPI000489C417|nr:DEAD/DEAH box helicase family protein [Enterocloster clostridioformis]
MLHGVSLVQDHEGKVWNQAAAYKWKLMGLIGFRMLRNFSLDIRAGVVTDISESGARRLIREVLCPEFNIFPPVGFDTELKHMVFHRMLDEQAGILNFLSEQRTAVINGAAGTGKTLIAVEKARRHTADGQKVLFLCFRAKRNGGLENQSHRKLV